MKMRVSWRRGLSLLFVFSLGLGMVAFAQEQSSPSSNPSFASDQVIVAQVNGEPIYLNELEEIWAGLPDSYRVQFPGGMKDLLEQLIRQTLLVQEAKKNNLESDPGVVKRLESLKKQVLVSEFIRREIIEKVKVDDEEIEKEYNANPTLYTEPERVKVSHIMVSSKERAEEVLAELKSGKPFEQVAKEKSESPDASSGGAMGYVRKGDLDQEIEKVVFELAPGSFSDIVETSYGFHIFLVSEHLKPRLKELSEVKEEIIARLTPQKQQEVFDKMIEGLKNRSEIAIIEENLPKENSEEDSGASQE
ncbi:MAG: peptidylprolyl isomerase [Candidatus Caldatribacteriaceae bacterium]